MPTADSITGNASTQASLAPRNRAGAASSPAPTPPGATAPAAANPATVSAAPTGNVPPVAPVQVDQKVRQMYPHLAVYLNDPELGPILRWAAAAGWGTTELQGAIYNTDWWKQHGESAREWDIVINLDPGEARLRLLTKVEEVNKLGSQYGVTLGADEAWQIADQALRFGWDATHLANSFGNILRNRRDADGTLPPGAASAQADALQAQAGDYLLRLSRQEAEDWALRIIEGTASPDTFTGWVTNLARGRFSWMEDDLNRGVAPGQYFSQHKQTIADILETSADMVDLTDPKWAQVIDYADPKTGQRRGMTTGEAADFTRSLDEYKYTDQANAYTSNLSLSLLREFGAIR